MAGRGFNNLTAMLIKMMAMKMSVHIEPPNKSPKIIAIVLSI